MCTCTIPKYLRMTVVFPSSGTIGPITGGSRVGVRDRK